MKRSVVFALILMGVFVGNNCTALAMVKLTLAHFVPPPHAQHKVLADWSARVNATGDNLVHIDVKDAESSPVGPLKLYEAMQVGVVDIIWIPHEYAPQNLFPLTTFFNLPFMTKSAEQGSILLWEVYKKFLIDEHRKNGVKVLWLFSNPPSQVNTKNKSIKNIADMKGIKIGVTGSLIIDSTLKKLGAIPIQVSVNDMTQALTVGMIEGVALPFEVLPPFGAHKVLKHYSIANINSVPMLVGMSLKKYNSLPSEVRRILDENSGERMVKTAGKAFDATEAKMKEVCRDSGGSIQIIPGAEIAKWEKVTNMVAEEWVEEMNKKGLPGTELLNYVIELLNMM